MRLSVALSGILCASLLSVEATTLVADFGSNASGGKGNYASVTKNGSSPSTQATFGTDWTGSDSFLKLQTDNLTFTFPKTSQTGATTPTTLTLKDGFKIQRSGGGTVTFTIKKEQEPQTLTTFAFGQTPGASSVLLGEYITLTLDGFTKSQIVSGLVLQRDSHFKGVGDLENNGTITLQKDTSLEGVKSITSTSRGKIILEKGITATISGAEEGSAGGTGTLTMLKQDISIGDNATLKINMPKVAKPAQSPAPNGKTLILKLTDGTSSRGEGESYGVTFKGGKDSKITLEDFTALETQSASFENITLNSKLATLKNTKLALTSTTLASENALTIQAGSASTFVLTGENTINAKTIQVKGTHSFEGKGVLKLQGEVVTFGEEGQSSQKAEITTISSTGAREQNKPKLQILGKLQTKNLKISNLDVEILSDKSTPWENKNLVLNGGTITAKTNDTKKLSTLEISNEAKNTSYGTISVTGDTTLKGSDIGIYGQTITLGNGSRTPTPPKLTLEAEGTITLGKQDTKPKARGAQDTQTKDGKVTISGNTSEKLELKSRKVVFGDLTLNKLNVTITSPDFDWAVISGADASSTLTLGEASNGGPLTITTQHSKDKSSVFQALSFESAETSTIKVDGDTSIKASKLGFSQQDVKITSGKALSLYALGVSGGEPIGEFNFKNTSISNSSATNSSLKLYAKEKAKLFANNLTLENIQVSVLKSSDASGTGRTDTKAKLDLSSGGTLNALGAVTIEAGGIYSGENQGFGLGINVGNSTKTGTLILKSGESGTEFRIDGSLTIDNTAKGKSVKTDTDSSFDVELNGKKLSDHQVALNVGGVLRGIGTSTNVVTIKAQNFTFGEHSRVEAINTALYLDEGSASTNNSPIDLKGIVYLSSADSNEAQIKSKKANNGGNGLKIKHLISQGKARIEDKLTFDNANLEIFSNGNAKTLTLKNTDTASSNKVSGVSNISLHNADLIINNGGSNAELEMTAGGSILSQGDSSIQANKVSVASSGTYTLQVKNGTLTLQESTPTGNAIGDLTLGDEKGQQGGHLILQKSNGSGNATHNSFTLNGNLKSYGDTSITASGFTLNNGTSRTNQTKTISINNGELKFIKGGTTRANAGDTLTIGADVKLNAGSLSHYKTSSTLGNITLNSGVSITSQGNSAIKAGTLTLASNDINVGNGELQLIGSVASTSLSTTTATAHTIGDLKVQNQGVFKTLDGNGSRTAIKLASGKAITLSAEVGYVNAVRPIGKGVFGKVEAKSIEFEGSGKLINITLDTPKETKDDRLFALRAGDIVLIDTEDGIKKAKPSAPGGAGARTPTEKITLEDISVNTGRFHTLTLTPKLIEDTQKQFVQKLALGLSVSQTKALELLESVENPQAKAQLQSLITSGNNQAIIDSILTTNNALKIGLAESIASGNVTLASQALFMINQSFANLGESIYAGTQTLQALKMIRHNNYEARMARKGNPFNSKNEVASLIQEASKYHYANNDDSLLIGLLDEPQPNNPFQGELWATYDGAINANQTQNATLNGMSAGYDLILGDNQEYLLGFALSYGYGTYTTSTLTNYSHNIGLGVYTRMFFGENEIDLTLSQNIGLAHSTNKLDTIYYQINNILNQDLSYNFYSTDLSALYGYSFKVGNEESPYYLKPLGGINFSFLYNGEAQGNGVEKLGMQSMSNYRLDIVLGMEMRKYLNEHTYFYLLPFLEKSLFNDGSDANIGFANALIVPYVLPRNNAVNLGIYAGGEGNITQGFALTGGIGAKMSVDQKEVFTNWNVGLRYRF
ncbi:hypothetical protein BBW65_01540 [Helicobacter enhydrae]|uniref:Autotransporter domain-containing protein n=1 Tax=Helicobacter enhydrae TaxID=222136 RepID=A0A1B1U480_9HELI|nr:hypothetical protein BBW65_01540 [Helicobacter enhydrae]